MRKMLSLVRPLLGLRGPFYQGLAEYGSCTVDLGWGRYELVFDPGSDDPIALHYRNGCGANEYLTALLPRFTKPGDTVLDLGAHIGTFALAAAARGCAVIAVDASPAHVDLLRRSARRNGFDRMRVVHTAIGDRRGRVRFQPAGLWGMVRPGGKNRAWWRGNGDGLIDVACTTGDLLLKRLGVDRVDLIKMDIEGSEVAAVRGLKGLLTRDDAPLICYECNGLTLPQFGLTCADLLRTLEGFGYTTYRSEGGRFFPFRPGDFQPEAWIDVIALKPRHEPLIAGDLAPPLDTETLIQRALGEATRPHPLQREYVGGALAGSGPAFLDDPRIRGALKALACDPVEAVRRSVAWWAAPQRRAG